MTQVLTSLNAVTADANGAVLAFNSTKFHFAMQYIVTMSSGGPITIFLEASLDGVNFSTVQSVVVGASGNDLVEGGGYPVLYIRARVAGMPAGATVTVLVSVWDQ